MDVKLANPFKVKLIAEDVHSKEKFPLYLKEVGFRYNNRHEEIFTLLTQNLCNLVPKLL